jgi:hypothetical protein
VSTADGDLQAALAGYLAAQKRRPVHLDELCQATRANRAAVSTVMARIVNGEARPYPVVRAGRGTYLWVHDPADRPAIVAVLAEMIGYMTGAGHDEAAELAATVLKIHAGEFG